MVSILSYGAGVQTFAMLCLIKQGKLPKPGLVVFCDLGNEMTATYTHMREYALPLMQELRLEYKVLRKGGTWKKRDGSNSGEFTGDLYQDCLNRGVTPNPPVCTKEYKVAVTNLFIKENFGEAETWLGYTTDEATRRDLTEYHVPYVRRVFPLLRLGLSRYQCVEAIKGAGMPVPVKSGCWFCPNRGRGHWLALKRVEPEKVARAVHLEETTGRTIRQDFRIREVLDQMFFDEDEETDCPDSVCGL